MSDHLMDIATQQLVTIARTTAYHCDEQHEYMKGAGGNDWLPHKWVVEAMRAAVTIRNTQAENMIREELHQARAQLAEAQALLSEVRDSCALWMEDHQPTAATITLDEKIETALSASAEPSEPIAWHVGGNGYDRICFEKPADLPGHPCIQAIHDLRQLIDLLKRYDLRHEDVPPDERAHGIPGTSFQRLNALANQGE